MTVNVGGVECQTGIDVSRYQGSIDWPRVAQCRAWAAFKASGGDGGTYSDAFYQTNLVNTVGLLPRGAYHFLGAGNGAAQADYFMRVTNGYTGLELPPTLDVETYGSLGQFRPSAADVRAFIAELNHLLPRRWVGPHGDDVTVIIYTGKPLESSLYPELAVYDLWLAAYLNPNYPNPWDGVTNGCDPDVARLGSPNRYVPRPWSEWGAWQFAGGDGGVGGVSNGRANCDQDVMRDDMFARLTNGGGGLSAAEVREINDHTDTAIAALESTMGRWLQEQSAATVAALTKVVATNSYNGRRFAFRIGAAPDVYLVSFDAAGATRTHVPDQATLAALIDIGAISPVLDIDVTDTAKAAALMAIREVPWGGVAA